MNKNSYFDGGLLQLIGYKILGFFITLFTLGICYPWACCMIYNWEIKHTVINGKRLKFDGTAIQLFGNWIKWLLLCIVTLGIYSFWMKIALKKWKTKHTYFDGANNQNNNIDIVPVDKIKDKPIKKELDKESKTTLFIMLIFIIAIAVLAVVANFVK